MTVRTAESPLLAGLAARLMSDPAFRRAWMPEGQIADRDDSDAEEHIWCCDPQVAICGASLSTASDEDEAWDGEDAICPLCALEDEYECGACGK